MKTIKILTVAIILAVCGGSQVAAQTARGGIKGGLNLSNLYIDDVEDENVRTGFHVGFFTQLMVAPTVAIQPELNYSTKGAKAEYNFFGLDGERKYNLSYLDVPVLVTFKLGDDADIHLGPYVGYLVGVNTTTEGDLGSSYTELDRDDYEKIDYGISGGFALNFTALSFGVRYNYGLNEIAKSDEAAEFLKSAKNSVAQVYAAINLRK